MNWLDTETKAILHKEAKPKLSTAKVAEFALVLIRKGVDPSRLVRAISRINECGQSKAIELSQRPAPITINPDLTEAAAIYGQFELICCDAISAVIRSEVVALAYGGYYLNLLKQISRSPEFWPVTIRIDDIPLNESGHKFTDQFLGMRLSEIIKLGFPRQFTMPAKKARIMKHWATRIGAQVRDNDTPKR
jgi:hypothetical protein